MGKEGGVWACFTDETVVLHLRKTSVIIKSSPDGANVQLIQEPLESEVFVYQKWKSEGSKQGKAD